MGLVKVEVTELMRPTAENNIFRVLSTRKPHLTPGQNNPGGPGLTSYQARISKQGTCTVWDHKNMTGSIVKYRK